tara:strand:+ start:86 stop:631 length:546 start_codon:yes stop_codon:yes gene_type:complete
MTTKIFDDLKKELEIGLTEKGHPFRYCTLGTVGLDKMARLRTIVLRAINKDLKLTFFTDKRSKKIIHITENNKVSALFYHPEKSIQLKIEGIATVIKDQKTLQGYWTTIPAHSKKEYTTSSAPGSIIKSNDEIEYLNEDNYFCLVHIEPYKIEYLKLDQPNHIRVRFSLKNEKWNGEYLVP